MKLLLEKWNNFLNEQKYSTPHSAIVASVDRALQILGLSSNANLRDFLIEIAIMESGGNPRGINKITHHVQNPFQVTGPAISIIQNLNVKKLDVLRDRIYKNAKMAQPWHKQSEQEIKSNVTMGALAAALVIIHKMNPRGAEDLKNPALDAAVPGDLKSRAALWKKIYNTGQDPHGTPEIYIKKNSL
jgi:hypothetical protein